MFTLGNYDKRLVLAGYNRFGVFLLPWRFIKYWSSFMNIYINSFIFIDLHAMIRNPFKPRQKVNKYFVLATGLTTLFFIATFVVYREELSDNISLAAMANEGESVAAN